MTKKIFRENPGYQPEELKEKLKTIFGISKLAIIPMDERIFGHADGMIRFIDDKTVLLNGYFLEYGKKYQKELFEPLEQCGLKWKFLHYNVPNPDKRNWAYINFLQTKDILLIPQFNIPEDQQALEQFCEYYSEYAENNRIQEVDMTEIIKDWGALNCITWNLIQNFEQPSTNQHY
jgi:agmatine/peptidylarginine deiminase